MGELERKAKQIKMAQVVCLCHGPREICWRQRTGKPKKKTKKSEVALEARL